MEESHRSCILNISFTLLTNCSRQKVIQIQKQVFYSNSHFKNMFSVNPRDCVGALWFADVPFDVAQVW